MSDDILARIPSLVNRLRADLDPEPRHTQQEAADALETAQARIAELEGERDELNEELGLSRLLAERIGQRAEKAETERDQLKRWLTLQDPCPRAVKAEAEAARYRGALDNIGNDYRDPRMVFEFVREALAERKPTP